MTSTAAIAIARDPGSLATVLAPWRESGCKIAFVPTMGALHDGHLSLIQEAQARADRVVVSVFVNPRQFGPNEDFGTYPRTEDEDVAKIARAEGDVVYLPSVEVMYPAGYQTSINVGDVPVPLDGASRPGFFDGIATVVTKLFNQVKPDLAVFGEKDFQQLLVIRRLVTDLNLPIEIIGAPIIREADGLAMSSRNRYLSPEERQIAGHLNQIMRSTLARLAEGEPLDDVLSGARDDLEACGLAPIDYFELRRIPDLSAVSIARLSATELGSVRLFAAVMLGRTRLIDNMGFNVPR
ncbi:pantoate--beta-alanine ligase [Parvularcula sp. LCG005]|uniref:pantoate--beta-alanine ligase n=1 Tax=Parvularcula sp. LCG005 TaxID=3078805 RepID=UPI0029424AA5|nr:pantoate--beta-alanine ligase [Parvularcula sp. LCG005]WOI54149.1 pantoate--beta-alanine ligase [Parvularcula sp. LCG005]